MLNYLYKNGVRLGTPDPNIYYRTFFYSKKSCAALAQDWGDLEMAALLKGLDTLGADVLTTEHNDILGIITENTGRLILSEDNGSTVHVDL